MGLFSAFGSIGSVIGSFFGGSSSGGGGSYRSDNRNNNKSNDKSTNRSSRERVTVVENKGAVEAARLENERVGLVKEAQLKIIEA